jgi:hypothetical protein
MEGGSTQNPLFSPMVGQLGHQSFEEDDGDSGDENSPPIRRGGGCNVVASEALMEGLNEGDARILHLLMLSNKANQMVAAEASSVSVLIYH